MWVSSPTRVQGKYNMYAVCNQTPCSLVRFQGFIVHGKKPMHKWHRIATTTIESSRLSRQQNKLTPTGCESTEAIVLTVTMLEVSKWKVLGWIVSLG